jgi:hypothetical protein
LQKAGYLYTAPAGNANEKMGWNLPDPIRTGIRMHAGLAAVIKKSCQEQIELSGLVAGELSAFSVLQVGAA